MALLQQLFARVERKQRATLLQVLVKRLLVSTHGEIVDYELNKPFTYLRQITEGKIPRSIMLSGSTLIRLGASSREALLERLQRMAGMHW